MEDRYSNAKNSTSVPACVPMLPPMPLQTGPGPGAGGVGRDDELQVERRPEREGEGELEGEVEEMVGEAVGVAGEGAVVRDAPAAELGRVGDLDLQKDDQDVEEDGDQERPAEVSEPLPPGDARHGEEEGREEHQVEV